MQQKDVIYEVKKTACVQKQYTILSSYGRNNFNSHFKAKKNLISLVHRQLQKFIVNNKIFVKPTAPIDVVGQS